MISTWLYLIQRTHPWRLVCSYFPKKCLKLIWCQYNAVSLQAKSGTYLPFFPLPSTSGSSFYGPWASSSSAANNDQPTGCCRLIDGTQEEELVAPGLANAGGKTPPHRLHNSRVIAGLQRSANWVGVLASQAPYSIKFSNDIVAKSPDVIAEYLTPKANKSCWPLIYNFTILGLGGGWVLHAHWC